jgi:pimeloyl-ACP methyl ester carboxylesterase
VLLLHGLGAGSFQWLPFVWPLRNKAQFIMPDFRGAGGSAAVNLNQADMFQNHVEDVEDIVRHFGLRDFLLAGHSMGATTALHWLHSGGFQGVRAYLHIDQSPSVSNQTDWPYGLLGAEQESVFQVMRDLQTLLTPHVHHERLDMLPADIRTRALQLLARLYDLQGIPLLALQLRAAAKWTPLIARLPIQRTRELLRILSTYLDTRDYRESLRACTVPVTVMVGMRSVLYAPAGQMAIADYAPQCAIVRFEKSGHLLPLNEPVKFLREFRRFVAQ